MKTNTFLPRDSGIVLAAVAKFLTVVAMAVRHRAPIGGGQPCPLTSQTSEGSTDSTLHEPIPKMDAPVKEAFQNKGDADPRGPKGK